MTLNVTMERRSILRAAASGELDLVGSCRPHWLADDMTIADARVMLVVSEALDVDPSMLSIDHSGGSVQVLWCNGSATVDDLVKLQDRIGKSITVNLAGAEEVFPDPAFEFKEIEI